MSEAVAAMAAAGSLLAGIAAASPALAQSSSITGDQATEPGSITISP